MMPVSASGIVMTIGFLPANWSFGAAEPPPAVSASSVPSTNAPKMTILNVPFMSLLLAGVWPCNALYRMPSTPGSPPVRHLLRIVPIVSRGRHSGVRGREIRRGRRRSLGRRPASTQTPGKQPARRPRQLAPVGEPTRAEHQDREHDHREPHLAQPRPRRNVDRPGV